MTTTQTTAISTEATDAASELRRLAILLNLAEGAWALALYEDGAVRRRVIVDLRPALAPLALIEVSLAGHAPDLQAHMQQAAQTAQQPAPVVSFSDLSSAFPALFGYLDIHRETLARMPQRLLLWLTEAERRELARQAPNFYSRLSGVFRFPGRIGLLTPSLALSPSRIMPADSDRAGTRRRPYVPVANERERPWVIAQQQSRLSALRDRARPDLVAIGDAWYDLAGLYEEDLPRRWDEAAAAYAEAGRAYAGAGRTAWQAEALFQAADAARRTYATEASLDYAQNSLTLYRLLSDGSSTSQTVLLGEANVLRAIGDVQQFRKDMAGALGSYGQAQELYRQVGDRLGEANVLQAIGDVQQFRNDREGALASYGQALELYRQVGDRLGEANVLLSLGDLARQSHDYAQAWQHYTQAQQHYTTIDHVYSQARVLYRMGDALVEQQRKKEAIPFYEQAIARWRAIGMADLVSSILLPRLQSAQE